MRVEGVKCIAQVEDDENDRQFFQWACQEVGLTHSPCFGAPFMPLPPLTYAQMFGERIVRYKPDVWLVNTGWSGGPYGEGGRIWLGHTRAIIQAILSGRLRSVETKPYAVFGINVPLGCPEVPAEILDPRQTWRDKAAYDRTALRLASMFEVNFSENAPRAPLEVKAAGPLLERENDTF